MAEKTIRVALAGNPNVGKSTVFNALTGAHQHTGNWSGKTVEGASGSFQYAGRRFVLEDVPGAYSLAARSAEEERARDILCFGDFDAVIVVCDATCLSRNLTLALQIMERREHVVICINLMDEAEKKGIKIDSELLEKRLGVPVAPTAARSGAGMDALLDKVLSIVEGKYDCRAIHPDYGAEIESEAARLTLPPEIQSLPNPRWTALRILEGEESMLSAMEKQYGIALPTSKSGDKGEEMAKTLYSTGQ